MRSNDLDLLGGHHLDLEVEELEHPQVLGPRHAVHAADDRRLPRAAQDVAQRQTAGDGIGVGIVVQQDEDAIGVRQIPLILLDALTRHRSAQLDLQRRAGELGQRQAGDFGKRLAQLVRALGVFGRGAQHPDQRAAGGADGLQHLAQRAAAVVFDDDTGAGRDVGLDVGVDALRVADTDAEAGLVEAAGERGTFDQDVELGVGREHGIEQPHDQLRVTDREAPHSRDSLAPHLGRFHTRTDYSLRSDRRPMDASTLWPSAALRP